MTHFIAYKAPNQKIISPSISKTIQIADAGKTFKFGTYNNGVADLKIDLNDPSYGIIKLHKSIQGSKDNATLYDLLTLRAGKVIVQARNPGNNAVLDYFQLEIKANPVFYIYSGHFDKAKFETYMKEEFKVKKDGKVIQDLHFDESKMSNVLNLLKFIESDSLIIDIRWMAYMLATVYLETLYPSFKNVPVLDKKTRTPVLGPDKNPIMKKRMERWAMTMDSMIDEYQYGKKGSLYRMPVKVMKLPDGSARITENDGDQFTVRLNGKNVAITKHGVPGAVDGGVSVKDYNEDPGEPLKYHGRGYMQLTWWYNYATAGAGLNRGLEFLFNPDLVKQPEISYAIMSHSMRTGHGFANGRKFVDYFSSNITNDEESKMAYQRARAMVNVNDRAIEFADYAKKFEKILLLSKAS